MANAKEINIILGTNIKKIRNELGLTREKLAEKIDVSTRFLAEVESGNTGVSLTTLKNLCLALNTSADTLLGIADFNPQNLYLNSVINKLKDKDETTLKNISQILDSITAIKENPKN